MWAPSMPPRSDPSTRLSRVAAQDACLVTSMSGRPYLVNRPFSLAMITGEESVRAMKPSRALETSGPAPAANAPEGKAALAAAAVAAAAVSARRRVRPAAGVETVLLMAVMSCGSELVFEGQPHLGPRRRRQGRADRDRRLAAEGG